MSPPDPAGDEAGRAPREADSTPARTPRRSRWPTRIVAALALWAGVASAAPDGTDLPLDCPPTAESPSAQRIEAALRDARDRGFLWRASKDGRNVYLYGTLHVARFDWMFPGPRVRAALLASDTLALELDLLDPEIQRRMAAGLAQAAGAPLPAALRERIATQARALCVRPDTLALLGPQMQVATLALMAARRDGLDPAYGIDVFLAGFGRGVGKAVVSLETPEQQLALLQSADPREVAESVEQGLAELEAGRARPAMLRIAAMWAASDHAELERYDDWCECRRTAAERDAMQRLLEDRNPLLADRIVALHDAGRRVFAAVGSLHMVGPTGLQALLVQRGFRVERTELRP